MAGADNQGRGRITRRRLISNGSGLVLGAALGSRVALGSDAFGQTLRHPDLLPDLGRPAGEPDPSMPFDHIVFVMMDGLNRVIWEMPRRCAQCVLYAKAE